MDEKKYSYKFTPLAEEDINNIFDYIALELSSPVFINHFDSL